MPSFGLLLEVGAPAVVMWMLISGKLRLGKEVKAMEEQHAADQWHADQMKLKELEERRHYVRPESPLTAEEIRNMTMAEYARMRSMMATAYGVRAAQPGAPVAVTSPKRKPRHSPNCRREDDEYVIQYPSGRPAVCLHCFARWDDA